MDRPDALDDDIEGSWDAPDSIMNFPGTVDRDDHIIEEPGDIVCALEQQKACRQKSETDILLAKELAECAEVAVQQRLTARQHHLADAEVAQRRSMTLQIGDSDLFMLFPFPNVTHDATAVAMAMNIQD
jgi:hypothetical protein